MSNPADRRRSARVEMLGKVQAHVMSLDMAITVREMSLGGMSVETPTALEVGTVKDFLLTLGDGAGVEVFGRIVYSRPVSAPGQSRYLSGIQFVDQDDLNPQSPVGGLIAKAQ